METVAYWIYFKDGRNPVPAESDEDLAEKIKDLGIEGADFVVGGPF